MIYQFNENDLRMSCSRLRGIELELNLLKNLIEDLKLEILGFAEDQKEEKENGTL